LDLIDFGVAIAMVLLVWYAVAAIRRNRSLPPR
jgi:hypothetical protein